MSANPYSLETYVGYIDSASISKDVVNHYLSYMRGCGFSIHSKTIDIIESVLSELYPDGITFQLWYTFDKGNSKDDIIKQKIALENMRKQSSDIANIVNENSETPISAETKRSTD